MSQIKFSSITDLFGNTINVSNLDEAIIQAKGGYRVSEINLTPFELVNGNRRDIKGREEESVPVSDYWNDTLKKLNLLKAKKLWSEFGDIPLENDSDNIDESFLHFEAGTEKFEIWSWFERTFDVSIADDLMRVA